MVADRGLFESSEIVAQIAEIRQQTGADEFAVTAGQAVNDVALRAHDLPKLGEILSDIQ